MAALPAATRAIAVADPASAFAVPCRVDDSPWPWIGVPHQKLSEEALPLVESRHTVVVWGGADDPLAVNEFDETAIVSLGGVFYLVQANGCSCPPRTESWDVEGFGTLIRITAALHSGHYRGFSFPPYAKEQIATALDLAACLTVLGPG